MFDAPYRLDALLTDLHGVLGAERRVVVACSLTMPKENFVRGTLREIVNYFKQNPFKGEFVILVAGKQFRNS